MRAAMIGLALTTVFASRGVAQESPVVVELFTSQGCSSCPPADAFLTDLARQRHDVLPLAFHVTYWDSLGWKDPYSLEAATARQREYAHDLGGDDGLYTPQMVVDGSAGFVGSERSQGLSVIAGSVRKTVAVSVAREGQTLLIKIGAGTGKARVLLVGFDPRRETHVGRGENDGRTLVESNLVRSLTPVGAWSGRAVELRQQPPAGESAAVLLQAGDGRILGAARLAS